MAGDGQCACSVPPRGTAPAGWPAVRRPGGVAAPGGVEQALTQYGDALISLFNSDPVRAIALVVGGAPGAVVTAFVEKRGNPSAAMKQAACDLSLTYAAAAIIIPAAATVIGGVVGGAIGTTYGALCALCAAILSYLCNGTPIPGSVVSNAAAASSSLAGFPLSSDTVAALRAKVRAGGNVRSDKDAEQLIAKGVLAMATDAGSGLSSSTAQARIDANLPLYTNKATLGVSGGLVPYKAGQFAYDWKKAGKPVTFWRLVALLKYRLDDAAVDLAVSRFPRRPPAPKSIPALRGSVTKTSPKFPPGPGKIQVPGTLKPAPKPAPSTGSGQSSGGSEEIKPTLAQRLNLKQTWPLFAAGAAGLGFLVLRRKPKPKKEAA